MATKAKDECFVPCGGALVNGGVNLLIFFAHQVHKDRISGSPWRDGPIHLSDGQSTTLPIITIHQQFPGADRAKVVLCSKFDAYTHRRVHLHDRGRF
ncbi:hypothetical protein D3C71_1069550 [compost metagenome]